MAYFDCIVGGSGKGNTLVVICTDDFAGTTITCTNGTKTYTKTCPSTAPYEVTFYGLAAGSWTISGVIEGQTYSETIAVTEYQLNLNSGFDYKTWVSRGGLDPDDYASLSAVFADESATRRLMLVHASADYLIDCVTDDITAIDDFCANDTAMKWLGLCDYVCDGLTAITGVEAKLLASAYWERYLKDHVPVMTSNTAPYGTAFGSRLGASGDYYMAFDGDDTTQWTAGANYTTNQYVGYKFVTPVRVTRVSIIPSNDSATAYNRVKNFKVQGSNTGDTNDWHDIYTGICQNTPDATPQVFEFDNDDYYLQYRVYVVDSYSSTTIGTMSLQFYGRQLSVSVPVMTSNTAPYGEVLYSSSNTTYPAWKCFDGNNSSSDYGSTASKVSGEGSYFGYSFTSPVRVKKFLYNRHNASGNVKIKFQYSDDKTTWQDCSEEITINSSDENKNFYVECNEQLPHKHWRAYLTYTSESLWFGFVVLQFYGLDYSEKEFEAGTTKKWLYDHGVELVTLQNTGTGSFTKDDNSFTVAGTNNSHAGCVEDLTDYNLARMRVGDEYVEYSYNAFCIGTSMGDSSLAVTRLTTAGNVPNHVAIDVSSINQSAAVQVVATQTGKIKCVEMWVE